MEPVLKITRMYRYDLLEHGLVDEHLDWEPFLQGLTEYSEKGHVIREITYAGNGVIEQITEYQVDENGQLILERIVQDGGEITETNTVERDRDGRVTKEIRRFLDGSEDITEYQYDDNGDLAVKITCDEEGEIERIERFEYINGLLVTEHAEDGEGNLLSRTTYAYDSDNRLEQTEHLTIDDSISQRMVSFFDEQGNRIKNLKYNSREQLIEITRFQYDEHEKLQQIQEENQRGNSVIYFQYDEKGNVVSQEEVREDGTVVSTIQREFDEAGRILMTKVFIDGLNIRPNQQYQLRYRYEFYE